MPKQGGSSRERAWQPRSGILAREQVIDQNYLLRVPDNLDLAGAAPLLCAGITVYSPMKYYGADKAGMKFGVLGLGGLGHMAVKFAKAMVRAPRTPPGGNGFV